MPLIRRSLCTDRDVSAGPPFPLDGLVTPFNFADLYLEPIPEIRGIRFNYPEWKLCRMNLDGDGDPPGCEALARDALDNCLGGCGAPGPTCAETCAIVARAGDEAELLAHHEKLGGTTHSRRLLRRCVRRCTA